MVGRGKVKEQFIWPRFSEFVLAHTVSVGTVKGDSLAMWACDSYASTNKQEAICLAESR